MNDGTNAPVLLAKGLSFGHRGQALGEPVDLDVKVGEVLCLLGPNGCGKTTLFRTVLGLIPALGGCVNIAGQAAHPGQRQNLARHVAYVPQAHAGVFAYVVQDVVLMGRASHIAAFAMPARVDRVIALEALQRLGIAHLSERPYTEISGGERQMVMIARALAQQTPLIVMDEPTASLDYGNQRVVLREIEALKARGTSVLLSTHQPEHALRIADRVALMRQGSLLALGETRGVMTATALADLYGIDAEEVARSLPLSESIA